MLTNVYGISSLCDSVLALVYPQACAVCGDSVESRHDAPVCAACWSSARLFDESDALCWKCGMPSRAERPPENRQAIRCGLCDDEMFTSARACGAYEGALRASVLALKRGPQVPPRLATLMAQSQKRMPTNSAELIIPVPLHADRERERGFNQAVLLARELARITDLPIDEYSLRRQIHTERHRAGMDARARRQSVAGSFAVQHPKLIVGRRVLLVDDVYTTGATVSTCAAALKDAGATEIHVLTIARA